MTVIENAYTIARKNLQELYAENGIHAGKSHFNDYWARDSFFACLGALDLGDYHMVKKVLQHFLFYQKPNGQFPLRIGTFNIILKLFGIETKGRTRARYEIDKYPFVPPVDQNSLFIMALRAYVEKTRDVKFLKDNYLGIEKAIIWNFHNDRDHDYLIEEGPFANWADSVKKSGEVLYTNVCHFKACTDYAWLSKLLGNKEDAREYQQIAGKIRSHINENYWNGHYYIDWISSRKKHTYFSTSGNVLAVAWGLADRAKAQKIQQCIEKYGINDPVPSKTNYPRFPSDFASFPLRLVGLGDYHNFNLSWLWLGCFDVIAKHAIGMKKEAKDTLEKIAKKIVEYNGVYEIYGRDGKPVKRLLYQSEFPFAWSSGMFIHACHTLRKAIKS